MSKVIHRFVRQPNLASHDLSRVGNRFDPFKNTLSVLQDPKRNRQLYLIGTTNSSTTLAYRTKKLVEQIKPTSVYVQASSVWWNHAKHANVSTQQEFNRLLGSLPQEKYIFQNNLRGILFRLRYYLWMGYIKSASSIFCIDIGFPNDFNFWNAGLETKFALEKGESSGAQLIFGGRELDVITTEGLRLQADMYPHTAIWRSRKFARHMSSLSNQYHDFYATLHARGAQAFAESLDRSRCNYIVHMLNQVAPIQKRILIDQRDLRIFRQIHHQCQGQRIVAVVNQWHMEGVQTLWRYSTGTVLQKEHLSPIADMDIDMYQEQQLINDFLRDYTSQVTKSEPATSQNALTSYHKQNYEYERTRHTHHNSHEDIPQPGQEKQGGHH